MFDITVVDEELDVELCITGSRRGILDETIYCNIDFISTPVYLNVKTNFEVSKSWVRIPPESEIISLLRVSSLLFLGYLSECTALQLATFKPLYMLISAE